MWPTTLGAIGRSFPNVATGSAEVHCLPKELLDSHSNLVTETSRMAIHFSRGAIWLIYLRAWYLIVTTFLGHWWWWQIPSGRLLICNNSRGKEAIFRERGPASTPQRNIQQTTLCSLSSGSGVGIMKQLQWLPTTLSWAPGFCAPDGVRAPCSINVWNMTNALLLFLVWINNLTYFKTYFKGFKLIDGPSKGVPIFLLTTEKHTERQKWEWGKRSRGCVTLQKESEDKTGLSDMKLKGKREIKPLERTH